MTRSELIHRIAQQQSQFVERDVEPAVKMMLNQMAECLAGGGRIEIRGFASFALRWHRARVARNPRTGTPVSLPARYAAYFKPGKKLRERVNCELSEAQRHSGESEDPTVRFGQCLEIDARVAQPQSTRLWSGQQVADGQRRAGTARRFAQNAVTVGH